MDGPGNNLLPGSGFSTDQHRGIRDRNLADQLVQLLHGRAAADDFRVLLSVFFDPVAFQFAGSAAILNSPLQLNQQFVKIQRLGQVIERAQRHSFDCGRAGSVSRHDQDSGWGRRFFKLTEKRQAVLERHADVDKGCFHCGLAEDSGGFHSIRSAEDAIALIFQKGAKRFTCLRFIFCDQNRGFSSHPWRSSR